MGFGKMLNSAVSESANNGQSRMPNVFLDVREGKRTFRFIPDPANPREPLQGEIVLSLWLPVKRGDATVERRIFINDAMRKMIPENLQEKIKRRFFLNVYDRTRVVKLEDGTIVYPNLQNQYFAKDSTGKTSQLTNVTPKPNNTVMVLEGSVSFRQVAGRGGLLNELDDLSKTIYDDDGTSLIPITNVDIEMVTRGTGLSTTRSVHPGMNREPFPVPSESLQVYNLSAYTKAYPEDALKALLSGTDYNDVIRAYGLQIMPQLKDNSSSDADEIF